MTQPFEPIVNERELILRKGDVGVCTLWTPRERWASLLERAGIGRDIEERVAVVGNLYHPKGVVNILRNLYANPHIKELYIVGTDLSKNLVPAIKEAFRSNVSVAVKGYDEPTKDCSLGWLHLYEYSFRDVSDVVGSHDLPHMDAPERIFLEPPYFESDSLETPIPGSVFYGKDLREVWTRLRYYIQQFGTRYESSYGDTLEILGMTTVVPVSPYDESLPFSKEEGAEYVKFLLDPNKKPDLSYDYGPLLAGIMDIDREQFSTRHAYWPLYAPSHRNTKEPPCLVSCWFKERQGILHGSYVFRSQDMFAGYSRNVYGLHRFQNTLAEKHGLECGSVITHTHSAHIYERDIDLSLKSPVIQDPFCYCVVSVEKDFIKVLIERNGETIQELKGKSCRVLERELRHYVSDVSHAMYLGRELYMAEQKLKKGVGYCDRAWF